MSTSDHEPLSAATGHRPSGPFLPGDQAGGPTSVESPVTGDVRQGVDAWLAGRGAAPAPPDDEEALGPEADDEAIARKILLDQLTGQARSRRDLSAKLAKKGVPEHVAERLLDRFEDVGLVDDHAFARSWVQSRQAGKGIARRALAQELRRKGIDDDVAKEALDEVDPDDEVDSARMLVRRKLRTTARLERDAAIRRLTGMLARKGYPAGVAFRVVREELDAAGQDVDDLHDSFE